MGIIREILEKEISVLVNVLRNRGKNIKVEKSGDRFKIIIDEEVVLYATSLNTVKFLKKLANS